MPQLELALKALLAEENGERTKILQAISELKQSIREAQRAIAERKALLKESLDALGDAAKRESQTEADPSFRKLASARSRLNRIDSELNPFIASVEWLKLRSS